MGTRRLLVTSAGVTAAPTLVELDVPSQLMDPSNGAGYLVITHRDLADRTPGSSFEQFLAHRAAGGLPVVVAKTQPVLA